MFKPKFATGDETMRLDHPKLADTLESNYSQMNQSIYEAHPKESKLIIKVLNLRAEGILADEKIIRVINTMGSKSKDKIRWNKDKSKPVPLGRIKGKELTIKQMQNMVQTLSMQILFVIIELTNIPPIRRANFKGLVTIDTFNKANRGRIALIKEEDGSVEIIKNILRNTEENY